MNHRSDDIIYFSGFFFSQGVAWQAPFSCVERTSNDCNHQDLPQTFVTVKLTFYPRYSVFMFNLLFLFNFILTIDKPIRDRIVADAVQCFLPDPFYSVYLYPCFRMVAVTDGAQLDAFLGNSS